MAENVCSSQGILAMKNAVEKVFKSFRRLDILVNNSAEQTPQKDFLKITAQQLEDTFKTNIFSMF